MKRREYRNHSARSVFEGMTEKSQLEVLKTLENYAVIQAIINALENNKNITIIFDPKKGSEEMDIEGIL